MTQRRHFVILEVLTNNYIKNCFGTPLLFESEEEANNEIAIEYRQNNSFFEGSLTPAEVNEEFVMKVIHNN